MPPLVTRVNDLAALTGGQLKALRTLINGNLADLSTLDTAAKTSIVAAINEIVASINQLAAAAGATINDASTASTTQVWSVTKTVNEFNDRLASLKDEILGGAGAAYDTLSELKALLDEADTDIGALVTQIGQRVSTQADQGLTSTEKLNARNNIDVYSKAEIGDIAGADFVATLNTALAS